ncbi:MAG: hypothetical protein EOO61_02085 [Hymenobacter sp.]|nr:MAG: hypothetical protein EOO61_02085 [Hymenobacter sp.]
MEALLPQQVRLTQVTASDKLLRQGVWAYFLLLIFEGALRKWFLPTLATPLLLVRDPLAIWLLVTTWKRGMLPENGYITSIIVITVMGVFTAVLLGHGNLFVAIFGARILLIHFPLMFVIGRIFTREDVVKIGVALLWIGPQSAWVNRGVGGDMEGGGFNGGALGYFRPPGTFSFTTGLTQFYSFVAPFIFYFWLYPKGVNRLLLVAATASLFAVVPMSISRGLLFQVAISAIFMFIATVRQPRYLGHMFLAVCGAVVVVAALSQTAFFQTAIEVFTLRFDNASSTEGGLQGTLVDRYLGSLLEPINQGVRQPFFGYGLGMGTNVGSMLLTGGTAFLIAEGEWGRLIGEMGLALGLAIIFIRLSFCVKVGLACYAKLAANDMLPWMLLSFGLLIIVQGQWAQPTALGFSTLIGGLLIASLRAPRSLVVSS